MTHAAITTLTACMAALPLPEGAEVPDWVHLVPVAAGAIQTADRRGPYTIDDAQAVIQASFAETDALQVDENHAQDLAAPQGGASPARGWITEMQVRPDGIWGRVNWTASGRALVADRAYRAMSPVIVHDAAKRVTRILRASLVNRPNFRGLATLNQETDMFDATRLAQALNLATDATEEQMLAAIAALREPVAATQSAMTELATVLGVEGASPAAIVAAARVARTGTGDVAALQAELGAVRAELETIRAARARAASEAFIDQALREGRAGIRQDNREELVALHMEQPDTVRKLIEGMPRLDATRMSVLPPAPAEGTVALNAAQAEAARLLGVDVETYRKTLASERNMETI